MRMLCILPYSIIHSISPYFTVFSPRITTSFPEFSYILRGVGENFQQLQNYSLLMIYSELLNISPIFVVKTTVWILKNLSMSYLRYCYCYLKMMASEK